MTQFSVKPFSQSLKQWARTAAAVVIGVSIAWSSASADAASVHVATKTTTFWTLSQYYGLSVGQIAAANPNVNPNNIIEGQRLTIPTINNTFKLASAPSTTVSTAASAVSNDSVTVSGKQFDVARTIQMTATAYSADPAENGGWGGLDYFGNSLKVGTVAVDPSQIALGTKLYIVGYDYAGLPTGGMIATALDVGSAIKGNRIDLFVPGTAAQVSNFGIQYVKVYVLES
ncbi:3D domain-containing protein [Paenibacillus sp. PR3]|uniref:3D domain-containing protein n=1 Tax=Paenibacillus terricola TaxID=2763503 RepID=A0ABR8MZ33_9BACL|nr:3D domain-containing protein [Paenibacillus terricola]MBD3920205.1 3D domain-containing protein [Paenibacillus terricola]